MWNADKLSRWLYDHWHRQLVLSEYNNKYAGKTTQCKSVRRNKKKQK